MADDRSAGPAGPISRAALERVLSRAAQLQAQTGDGDDGGTMSEAQLIDLGKEVGLSADTLRQALAEERSRTMVPEEKGAVALLTGAVSVTAARTVKGDPAKVLAMLDALLQREEGLMVKRRFADQLVWEARRDIFTAIRRGLKLDGRHHALAEANDVGGVVAAIGTDRTHVRLIADFREDRATRSKIGVGLSIAFLITGVPLLVIGVMPIVAALPPLLAAGLTLSVTRQQYRKALARAQVALEQALDKLEFAEARPVTPGQALLDAIVGPPRLPR
jgi:hypothetical protein